MPRIHWGFMSTIASLHMAKSWSWKITLASRLPSWLAMPKRSSIHLAWRAALFASIGLLCSTACALAQGIDGDKVIVPSAASQEKRRELTSGTAPEGPSLSVVLAYLGLMGGGAYFVIHRMRKGRVGGLRNRGRGGIELRGSHMLGNRQFLVVAEVEGKRMLLG